MKFFIILAWSLAGLVALILLLLLVKIGFYAELIYTKQSGFGFTGKITWGVFSKQLNKKKASKKSPEKKPKEKSDASIVKIIKSAATIVKELIWVPGKVLTFKRQCVWCKVSLDDPMKNGITYGALSSALMSATQVIVCRFKTDEYKVRVTPDFTAKDGISIKDITWVQLRPLVLIICLIYAYTKSPRLRKAISELINEVNKDKGKVDENEG